MARMNTHDIAGLVLWQIESATKRLKDQLRSFVELPVESDHERAIAR